MKVVEHFAKATKPLISFEITPISRGGDINVLFNIIDDLIKYDPPFIDVTSHSAQVFYEETPTGIRKKVKRKKPGTIGISVAIKNKYNIDTVPHLLCNGFTKEEIARISKCKWGPLECPVVPIAPITSPCPTLWPHCTLIALK